MDTKLSLARDSADAIKGLPLHASYAMRNHRSSFGAALRQYGSWNNALRAAGIAPPTHRGRLSTVRALRDALQERPREAVPKALQQEAALHFGSLSKAIAALKKERKVSDGWSKTKIIAMLQHIHRAKKPLGYGATRRDNVALISAAEAYFGSWRKALQGLA